MSLQSGCVVPSLCFSDMTDEALFEFLHMEIVSHVYKEQQSSKGEMDNKVCSTDMITYCIKEDLLNTGHLRDTPY